MKINKISISVVFGILLIALCIISKMRTTNMLAPVEFDNMHLNGEPFSMDFYENQLSEDEMVLFETLVDRTDKFQGGIITLKKPLHVSEVYRVYYAFFDECPNYFYACLLPAFIGEDDKVLTDMELNDDTALVKKVILVLSCSNYENIELKIDESTSKIMNLDEYGTVLETNDLDEVKKIKQKIVKTENKMQEILAGIPDKAGQLDTLNYFCRWINENVEYDVNSVEKLQKFSAMKGTQTELNELIKFMCDNYSYESNMSTVLDGKALCVGYAKILSVLCNEVGIESHIVFGTVIKSGADHAFTAVRIGDKVAYVDLSGVWSYADGNGIKYRKENAVTKVMRPSSYFEYQFKSK